MGSSCPEKLAVCRGVAPCGASQGLHTPERPAVSSDASHFWSGGASTVDAGNRRHAIPSSGLRPDACRCTTRAALPGRDPDWATPCRPRAAPHVRRSAGSGHVRGVPWGLRMPRTGFTSAHSQSPIATVNTCDNEARSKLPTSQSAPRCFPAGVPSAGITRRSASCCACNQSSFNDRLPRATSSIRWLPAGPIRVPDTGAQLEATCPTA